MTVGKRYGKSFEQTRQVTEGLFHYLADTNWHTFAMSVGVNEKKRQLDVQIGGKLLRVVIDKEIVYEGFDVQKAADFFNVIRLR